MTLTPLLEASPVVIAHATAAIAAFAIGIMQLAGPKGTLPHRTLGWAWVLLMAAVALSSFRIHTICLVGPFSPIHILSILTLVSLPLAVLHARRHRVASHARTMRVLFVTALCLAGLFTLAPGRLMSAVVLGGPLEVTACR